MIHKHVMLAFMAAYPMQFFLLALVSVVVAVWVTINAKKYNVEKGVNCGKNN